MNNDYLRLRQRRGGFTLIELLVVIAIIGVLAGILLPVLSSAKNKAHVAKAQVDIRGVATAISSYSSDYNGRMPISKQAQSVGVDLTFGTVGTGYPNPDLVKNREVTYQANNSEVVAVLLDRNPTTGARGNPRNPKHEPYWDLTPGASQGPGLGPDLVFRDPWKSPYIISLDVNFDGRTRDSFYKYDAVSADPSSGPNVGLNGLVRAQPDEPTFEASSPVMVWSLGPDKSAAVNVKANAGVNKDNILSWE